MNVIVKEDALVQAVSEKLGSDAVDRVQKVLVYKDRIESCDRVQPIWLLSDRVDRNMAGR